jgi:outer membrane protein OmpA-like peptidoglycan-associated protein
LTTAEDNRMESRLLKLTSRVFALVSVGIMFPVAVLSQAAPAAHGATSSNMPSRWDTFLGYSYLAPKGTVQVPQLNGTVAPYSFDAVNVGGLFSGTYFVNRFVGIQAEYGIHEWGSQQPGSNIGTHGNDDGFQTIGGGLVMRFSDGNITPFVHALVDAAWVDGPDHEATKVGPAVTAGGGLDYETPVFNHHLAIRLFQADYEYMHADWGPVVSGGRANINAARLSAGIVLHAGSIAPPAPITLACSASPESIFPGDPVTLTATAGNLNSKDHVIYSWSGAGASGSDTTVKLDTSSLAPGEYTVNCNVKEGKPGKEGLKPWETASGTAGITVKAFEPPTISCSASPSTINPGDKSAITAQGVSPQNRPLTYSYSAPSGTVSGTGTTATYDSTGAAPGEVSVACNVSDDKGHSETANAMVTIAAPPPPPPAPSPEQIRLEARLALHSVFFPTDRPRPDHPEGGLVESQQGTLTTLATDFKSYLTMKPGARLTLTGHTDVRGSVEYNQALSDRRVNRVKDFLVEQGVPASSIDTRAVGKEQQLQTDQVKALVQQNPDLSDTEKAKTLKNLSVIVLAQNRRVDISLSTTGQQSVQLYPFNAADAMTLISVKAPAPKKAAEKKAK